MKKSFIHIRKGKIEDVYKFINENKHYYCKKIKKCFAIKIMCKVLGISRAAYYKHLNRKPSKWKQQNKILDKMIYKEYKDSKGRYGAVKILRQLMKKGFKPSLKRVQRRMKKLNIRSIIVKKRNPCCPGKVNAAGKENLIKENFATDTINKKWLTDITYIYTLKDGWCYLASVFDCCSAKIVGWHISKNMNANTALKAVKNAIEIQKPDSASLILHSDLGSQYTSSEVEEYLKSKGIRHSYSKKGYPYDNAPMESFHASLKKEEPRMNKYINFEDAKISIFEYIESWYNRKRIHSRIGYITPQECEDIQRRKLAA
ncbi:IS3 family transposase [Clostridium sp. Mt-5]|uniref:IS3 family transposase n=1 Tax=Clostridium moutaii TaxID=3240932 RepID=A0ABV4BU36_9CLOT